MLNGKDYLHNIVFSENKLNKLSFKYLGIDVLNFGFTTLSFIIGGSEIGYSIAMNDPSFLGIGTAMSIIGFVHNDAMYCKFKKLSETQPSSLEGLLN